MNKRWTVGLVGLGLAAVAGVPAAGRSHYSGRVPADIAAADAGAPLLVAPTAADLAAADPLPTPAPVRHAMFGHRKVAASVAPAHKKKSTAKHVTRHKRKARPHKAKTAK